MDEQSEQAVFWDERADAWAEHADAFEAFGRQFGGPAMDVLDPRPGQHVVDIGCGPGTTTMELGRRVAPGGSATGLDVSPRMVEQARARAAATGPDDVRFVVGDPGRGPIGTFDGAYSRFGVMFFDEPAVAFANIARSLRPGGRFVAVAWAELGVNPWMFLPTMFAAGPLQADIVVPGPDEPGPFSLADPAATTTLLESSGFVDGEVVRQEGAWSFDRASARGSIAQLLAIGAVGEAWASASDEARSDAVDAVLGGLEEHRDDDRWQVPATALVLSASAGS